MRSYELTLSDPQTGAIWRPSTTKDTFDKGGSGPSFSSLVTVNGQTQTNPGALNIELDIVSYPFNQFQGAAKITVWGVGLGMIGQAADFNANPSKGRAGANILLKAGMAKGLPLANPKQYGTILQGSVFQAFGNWQGTNMTLDLICYPAAARDGQDICWDWPAGTTLASALLKAFNQAFAKYGMVIDAKNITIANITSPGDQPGHYHRLSDLADYVIQISQSLGGPANNKPNAPYSGVRISITGNTIYAYDNTGVRTPKQLEFTDLLGQPTWIEPQTISFKTVLRSDIAVGDRIKFPTQGLATPYVLTTQNAASPNAASRSKTVFQGAFDVIEVHHFGNFRQPDADAWVTAFTAVAPISS